MTLPALTTELEVLAWSVVLLLVHVVAQASTTTASVGLGYNMSARDSGLGPRGVLAPRLARALGNFNETYPAFVALALALAVTGKSGGLGAVGAIVWIVARAVYLPIYAAGVPVVRTIAWSASVIGLVLMLIRLFG